ncbi:hypothetical protein JRQ81_012056, partial [Phrynocephalus forsythii]
MLLASKQEKLERNGCSMLFVHRLAIITAFACKCHSAVPSLRSPLKATECVADLNRVIVSQPSQDRMNHDLGAEHLATVSVTIC